MKSAIIHQPLGERRIGRSIGAIVAGAAVAIVLTVATDLGMQVAGLLPAGGWATRAALPWPSHSRPGKWANEMIEPAGHQL